MKKKTGDAGAPTPAELTTFGNQLEDIDVLLTYRIIELFSEGLYSSPNKAIEELVCNGFDAGAENVHVILPADFVAKEATIIVVDDGAGMDVDGFKQHWIIGDSRKRSDGYASPKARKPIGKFGIGKLATFVLAERFTHVSKSGGRFLVATMDYKKVPTDTGAGLDAGTVSIPLREIKEQEAQALVAPLVSGQKSGYSAVKLFGDGAADSWTVAVMSHLKPMASEIRRRRLRWVLATGMPIRSDFQLFLNGEKVAPSKEKGARIAAMVLGKDLKAIPKPASDELQVADASGGGPKHALVHPTLGLISGRVELFEDLLTTGKSTELGRSHGFFIYTHGRLINTDDEYFGIDSNKLRHGTFSRFRCEVHIDRLDDELRSSRESVRETSLLIEARSTLQGIFNEARSRHEKRLEETDPGAQAARRVADTPQSLARQPIVALALAAIRGERTPRLIRYPDKLPDAEQESFAKQLNERSESEQGLILTVGIADTNQLGPVAVYDASTGALEINALHPFVAHFLDEFQDRARNLPLELLAISEVLLEARLYELDLTKDVIDAILDHRDELLRHLGRSLGRRTPLHVSQDLREAANNKSELEEQLVAAFSSMGFDAIPIGGNGKPDGLASAHLPASADGTAGAYKVTLEAKSKENLSKKVKAQSVNVSRVARHRDDFEADHAIVVGPDFPTTKGDESAVVKEIQADRESSGKSITLVRVEDLARLVRLVQPKGIGMDRVRDLLQSCTTPEEAATWICAVSSEVPEKEPYKEMLDGIASEQQGNPNKPVTFESLETWLRLKCEIKLSVEELAGRCNALSRMAPSLVSTTSGTVALNTSPKRVLESIRRTITDYPEEDRDAIANLSF